MNNLTPKTFTAAQIKRLPKEGYLIEVFNGPQYVSKTAYCIKNGKIKYARLDIIKGEKFLEHSWETLLWTCCPTKGQIKNPVTHTTYEHFKTHEELIVKHPLAIFEILPSNDF